mmetsp:Transcript_10319/g.15794  ORF Transcript_10319/g.15794 Transcript_10319/m.15794 type:complete len:121 (-) Transcript_10319:1312-1674(-)
MTNSKKQSATSFNVANTSRGQLSNRFTTEQNTTERNTKETVRSRRKPKPTTTKANQNSDLKQELSVCDFKEIGPSSKFKIIDSEEQRKLHASEVKNPAGNLSLEELVVGGGDRRSIDLVH